MGRNPNSVDDYVIAFLVSDGTWNTELYDPIAHQWRETDITTPCIMPIQLAQTTVVSRIPTWFDYGGRTVAEAEKCHGTYMIARLRLCDVINSRFSAGAWVPYSKPRLLELGYTGSPRKYSCQGNLLPAYTYENARKCCMLGVL